MNYYDVEICTLKMCSLTVLRKCVTYIEIRCDKHGKKVTKFTLRI